jgi:NAD+ diphosphatase
MVAMHGHAQSRAISLNDQELDDARWFSRGETRALLEGRHETAAMPPRSAIAYRMVEWFATRQD